MKGKVRAIDSWRRGRIEIRVFIVGIYEARPGGGVRKGTEEWNTQIKKLESPGGKELRTSLKSDQFA